MISFGELQHGHLARVADVHRRRLVAPEEAEDALDQVGDVAEAARLRAVAVDRERLAAQRLRDEVRDDAAVVRRACAARRC